MSSLSQDSEDVLSLSVPLRIVKMSSLSLRIVKMSSLSQDSEDVPSLSLSLRIVKMSSLSLSLSG